jgi:hypothetical protein
MAKSSTRIRSGAPPTEFDTASHIKANRKCARLFLKGTLGMDKIENLEDALLDGSVLCKLAAKVDAKSVGKFHEKPTTAAQRAENMAAFGKATGRSAHSLKNFNNVLAALGELEAKAVKSGVYKPKAPKVSRTRPVASGAGELKGEFQLASAVLDPTRPLRFTRENYLGNVDMSTLPDTFFLRVMTTAELFDSLTLIAFTQGLEKIKKGDKWVIGTRGEPSDRLQACTFLRFVGFELIPTALQSGGLLVVADERRMKFVPALTAYWAKANKQVLKTDEKK